MRISACVITKNEEANIGRCLESLKTIVDEIILVDTGSTDKTLEIAASYGAKVYTYTWKNDFAAAKNFTLNKATGEWIIFLDADEYFSDDSIDKIRPYLTLVNKQLKCHGICVRIININQDADNREMSSFTTIRIFRKLPNIKYRNAIHEEIYNTKGTVNLFVSEDTIEVYHTGYSTSIVKKKLQRNLDIILQDIAMNGEQKKHYRYLCDCYHGLGEFDTAVKYGRLHINAGGTSLGAESIVYGKLIDSLLHCSTDSAEIKGEIQKAIKSFPDIPDFYNAYGQYAWGQHEYEIALDYFLKTIAIYKNKKNSDVEADAFRGRLRDTYFMMGEIYFLKNKKQKALSCYIESLLQYKYNIDAFRRLYYLILPKDPIKIIAILNKIYDRTKRDINFLVENIAQSQVNKVFAYYSNILKKDFSIEIDQMWQYQMIAVKNYDKFYEKSTKSIESKFQLITSMIIAENQTNFDGKNVTCLPNAYIKIVERFYQKETLLEEGDFAIYEMILYELMPIETNAFTLYVQIASDFSIDKIFHIANILENYNKYIEAIMLYEKIKAKSEEEELTSDERLGFCYYELQNYEKAKMFFAMVITAGKGNNKVIQFDKWCSEKLSILVNG